MRFKKGIWMVIVLIGVILIMGNTVPLTVQAQSKEPVKMGILIPLSPPGDPASGKRILWGAELAVKYVNEVMGGVLGGRPFQLAVEDDQGIPAEGVVGYRRLVTKDRVVAVAGQFHSSVCLAVNEVAKELGVPLFSTGASSQKITESQYPTIFSIMSLTPPRSEFFMEFAKKMGFKRVAVLSEDTDYGTGFDQWLKELGKKEGIEVKSIIFPRTSIDLTPSLLIIKAWNPELIINIGVGANAYLIVKQAFDLGLFPKVPMLASYDWPTRPEYWDAVGDKGNYILYMVYYKPGMPVTASGNWMIPKFIELHKEDPTFYALNVFGQVLVVAQAVNFAKSADPKDVLQALRTRTFTDWVGTVKFEEPPGLRWHNVSPPHLILQMTKPRQPSRESNTVWPPSLGGSGKITTP
jgi:branched-chain amino acid transport system substrate-binding protein